MFFGFRLSEAISYNLNSEKLTNITFKRKFVWK